MNKTIIAFTGCKGHGKDEASNALISLGYAQFAFADPLKAMFETYITTLTGDTELAYRMIHGDFKEVVDDVILAGHTPRHFMQTLGTEWGRHDIHDEIWVKAMLTRIKYTKSSRIMLTDLRFLNEAAMCRKVGATIVRIERPGHFSGLGDDHPSETELRQIREDITILNDGTIEDLHQKVKDVHDNLS